MNLLVNRTSVFACIILSLTGHIAGAQNINDASSFYSSKMNVDSPAPDSVTTIYGAFAMKADMTTKLVSVNNLGVKYVRETQLLCKWSGTKNYTIDFWRTHKKKMLLNINNDSTPSPFPTNLVAYENKLRSFLNVYAGNIALAVIENEELNCSPLQGTLYHLGSLQDYINELAVAVNVCRQLSLPVTNGGLTGPIVASLQHYYAVHDKQDSLVWLAQNVNGISNDSTLWMRTDSLLNAYKTLPLSYVNLHWYEPVRDSNCTNGVLQVVCNYITQQTGKKVITNETGVKTTDSSFVTKLIQQWGSARVEYCIFLDGTGNFGAQPLTSATGELLLNGIAFRDYVAGKNSCKHAITVAPGGSVATCNGISVSLTASEGFNNYLWSTGDTSQIISVNTTENYSVTSGMHNCTAFSNGVAVLVNRLPAKPVITATPFTPTNICPAKSVKLSSSSARSYLWNTGDTIKTITVNKPGGYFVTVTDVNGCKNTSDPLMVTYRTCDPPTNLRVSDIALNKATLNWDTALCSLGYQYQYREKGTLTWTTGQVLNSSTTYRYVYNLTPGKPYQWRILTRCKITPDTPLSSYADGPVFTTLAAAVAKSGDVESLSSNEETIFPVPAKNIATLVLSHISNDLQIELRDLNGKMLWQTGKITEKNISIPVSNLPNGIYMVIIKNNEDIKVLKLIKE